MQDRAWSEGVRPLSWIVALVLKLGTDLRRSDDSSQRGGFPASVTK